MTTAIAKQSQASDKMLHVLSTGDLSKLSTDERLSYFKAQCERAGLDPLSVPFEWLNLKGKLVLYAKKTATDQIAAQQKLKVTIVSEREHNGVYIVHARAEAQDGRVTDDIGAVSIEGMKGEAYCNALMKASSKAKRRSILALTGLGMLDESEVETIPGAMPVREEAHPAPALPRVETQPTTILEVLEQAKEKSVAEKNIEKAVEILGAEVAKVAPEERRRRLWNALKDRGMTAGVAAAWVARNRKSKTGDLTTEDMDALEKALEVTE